MASGQPPSKRAKTVEVAFCARRRFMPSWKNDFPWVTVSDGLMRCQYCTEAGKRNVFTTTGCDKLKKDALRKHALTNDHVAAVQAKAGRKDMQRAVANTYRQQELAVRAALRTIYFMAKKNLPNDMFSDLKQFQILQVSVACLSLEDYYHLFQQGGIDIQSLTFRGGRRFTYEHTDSVHGFQVCYIISV